ncbi:MAG: DUF512 domain-containing protein [Armatimonadota bacterium]
MTSDKRKYGKIEYIENGSLADESGLKRGDYLVSINSHKICDVLDFDYFSNEPELTIEIFRGNDLITVKIDNPDEEDLGIQFEEELFDGCRSCANNCIFCFLKQMPKGMRDTLYVRDDDFRLSFAQGNYITLTNLSDDDMQRILSQRMGPLYISVQATEPELRQNMLGNLNAGRIMEQLRSLADARISMHTQIVLCPGINDGAHLEKSINDLTSLHPWIETIAVVPVGLTKFRDSLAELRSFTPEEALNVVTSCTEWQKRFKKTLGTRLVFPSDEFYIRAGVKLPSRAAYEGFQQYENGVGISRLFMDELKSVEKKLSKIDVIPGRYMMVTGTLASGMVSELADILNRSGKMQVRVCAVVNKFFGETVTVAGLLTGVDVAVAIQCTENDEIILIPEIMLNENRFLDDMTISELMSITGRQVISVPISPKEMINKLQRS